MRTVAALLLLAFLPAASCSTQTNPPPPVPVPIPTVVIVSDAAPPQQGDSCDVDCEHRRRLGCTSWTPTCADDCRRLDQNLQATGQNVEDHACITRAPSCAEMAKCR